MGGGTALPMCWAESLRLLAAPRARSVVPSASAAASGCSFSWTNSRRDELLSGSSETASDAGGAKGAEEQEAGVWAPAPLWLNPLWQGLSQQEQDEL